MKRWTIAATMLGVALVAFGMAALIYASEEWAEVAFLLSFFVLLFGLLIAVVRRAPGWSGFAIFGLGYFLLVFLLASPATIDVLPTTWLLDRVGVQINKSAAPPSAPTFTPPGVPTLYAAQAAIVQGVRDDVKRETDSKWYYKNIQTPEQYRGANRIYYEEVQHTRRVGHSLFSVVFGLLGALLGRFLAPGRRRE